MMNLKSFLISALRGIYLKWPPRNEAFKLARVGRNQYLCNMCKKTFPKQDVNVDHIIPVIDPVKGFIDFNVYINNLFCNVEQLQVLCKECHNKKTNNERKIRFETHVDNRSKNSKKEC